MTEANERRYEVQITERQAKILRDALEIYSRLKAGQIDTAILDAFRDRFHNGEWTREKHDELCSELKRVIFPELSSGQFYSVGSKVYPAGTIAWDMMQVLRHQIAWDSLADRGLDKPEFPGMNDYQPAMRFGEEPLMGIRENKGRT